MTEGIKGIFPLAIPIARKTLLGRNPVAGNVKIVLEADGKTLDEHAKITSPRLPRAITYTLKYKRIGPTVTASH